MRGLATDF